MFPVHPIWFQDLILEMLGANPEMCSAEFY